MKEVKLFYSAYHTTLYAFDDNRQFELYLKKNLAVRTKVVPATIHFRATTHTGESFSGIPYFDHVEDVNSLKSEDFGNIYWEIPIKYSAKDVEYIRKSYWNHERMYDVQIAILEKFPEHFKFLDAEGRKAMIERYLDINDFYYLFGEDVLRSWIEKNPNREILNRLSDSFAFDPIAVSILISIIARKTDELYMDISCSGLPTFWYEGMTKEAVEEIIKEFNDYLNSEYGIFPYAKLSSMSKSLKALDPKTAKPVFDVFNNEIKVGDLLGSPQSSSGGSWIDTFTVDSFEAGKVYPKYSTVHSSHTWYKPNRCIILKPVDGREINYK